jgi:hypothetical protein
MEKTAEAPNIEKLTSEQAREERAYATGIQAALWGRPLVLYTKTHHAGLKAGAVGANYYRKYSELKTAKDRFVNTPNNVSIDAYAGVELRDEPAVLKVPPIKEDRWYIVQISDCFDEIVYNIGGSKGPEPGLFLITGPDYHGPVPFGMKEIKMRTQFAAIGNRIFVNGEKDLRAALAVQQGFHLLPLSVFQKKGLKYEVVQADPSLVSSYEFQPAAPEFLRQFEELGFAMKRFLSASDDFADPMVMSFHQIGLSIASGFEHGYLDEPCMRGLKRAAIAAEQIIEDAYANSAEIVDGWRYTMAGGRAGHDLALRAAFASNLTGANVPEEIIYPNTRVDDKGEPLSGAGKYVLHFDKETIPPVSVFWNLNMYDDDEFFIENDFGRYSIGSTTDGLKINADGSIEIFIQKDNPGADKESNWLPAPAGSFNLTMRLYGAQTPILDGSYRLPGVKKTS